MSMPIVALLVTAVLLFALLPAVAEISLPAIFCDHMVLQRQMKAPVWGQAAPGERVTVMLAGQTATAIGGADGHWNTQLGPFEAGGPFTLTVQGQGQALAIQDVLIGEVWLCSGQSNMQFALADALNARDVIPTANLPRLREFNATTWSVCTPETAKNFSAVAFFFARALQEKLRVPVGIVTCAVGGSPIETWISPETLREDAQLKQFVLDPWLQYARTATDKSAITPDYLFAPGNLFTTRIYPLAPYGIRGALWYQGESNAWGFHAAQLYADQLPALIRNWRQVWGQGDFPFITVQLPNYPPQDTPYPLEPNPWVIVQEIQAQVQRLPNTALVVTIDLGEADIHPRNKQPVGERAASAARKLAYGEKALLAGGPRPTSIVIEGHLMRLGFADAGDGLVAHGGALLGFALAGIDRRFFWATAKIEGNTVLLSSDAVPTPVAIRYAFAEGSPGNLYNSAGLPASPFRTDNWSWDTPPAKAAATLRCPRTAQSPVIDGAITDPAWAAAQVLTDFTLPHCYAPSAYRTEARFMYDERCLYFAVRCAEPNPAHLVANAKAHDDITIWTDDMIELCLDPRRSRRTYYRLLINANGICLDGAGFNNDIDGTRYLNLALVNGWRGFDTAWSPGQYTVKTSRMDGAWILETAIPWAILGVDAPAKGLRLGVHITRTHADPWEISEYRTLGRDENTGAMMPTNREISSPARYAEMVLE